MLENRLDAVEQAMPFNRTSMELKLCFLKHWRELYR